MRILFFALVAAGLATTTAQAGPRAGVSEACRSEVMQLCPKTGDKDARRGCMKQNREKISEGCRTEIRAAMEKRRAQRGAEATTTPAPTPQ